MYLKSLFDGSTTKKLNTYFEIKIKSDLSNANKGLIKLILLIWFVFSNDEASSVTKSIYEFTEKNEVPFIVKIGLLNDELVDEATLIKLSKLPSKEVLLSKLIGNMNSPISNFVFLMSANVRSFVNVLQRHIDQSAKEEAPAEEPKEEAPAEEPNKEEKK